MRLRKLADAIDQLNSEPDIPAEVVVYLSLAWWHAEDAYRQETQNCSSGHALTAEELRYRVAVPKETTKCMCCRYFRSLTTKAQLHRIA